MLSGINQFFLNIPDRLLIISSWLLMILIGIGDIFSPTDFQIDIIYLLPILAVAWYVSEKAGVSTSVFAAVIMETANRISKQSSYHWTLSVWNAFGHLVFFFMIVILLSIVKRKEHQLEELATQDPLTNIANRRSFTRFAQLEIHRLERHGPPFTVAYIDLDDFKIVNDTLGHNMGDTLLRHVADIFHHHIRDIDTVARLGGDEFAILLPETDSDGARQVMERIHHLLQKDMVENGWPVTFSTGVMTYILPPSSVAEMVEFADTLMYSVKRSGKNNIAFERFPG